MIQKLTAWIGIAVFVVSLTGDALAEERDGNDGGARATATERAKDAWRALERHFGVVGPGYPNVFAYLRPKPPQGELRPSLPPVPNYVWPQGQVVRAALNLAKLTGDYDDFSRTVGTLSRYLLSNHGTTGYAPIIDAAGRNSPPVRWWDDNGVTALVLLQGNAQVPGAGYLQAVHKLWPFFLAGQWPGGGQRENEARFGQAISLGATASDDQSVERLYLATNAQDPQHANFLNFALANDARIKKTLRAPGGLYWGAYYPNIQTSKFKWCDGTVWAHGVCSGTWWACNPNRKDLPPPQQLPPTPHVCAWMFDYNQGLMIGSDVLLYRITRNASYLQSATRTANAALDYYTLDRLWAEPSWFNADYFVALFQLDYYAPNPRIRAALDAYLKRAWNEGRDPETGLFNRGGIGYYDHKAGFSSLDQAAFPIMFSLLAWPRESLPDLY